MPFPVSSISTCTYSSPFFCMLLLPTHIVPSLGIASIAFKRIFKNTCLICSSSNITWGIFSSLVLMITLFFLAVTLIRAITFSIISFTSVLFNLGSEGLAKSKRLLTKLVTLSTSEVVNFRNSSRNSLSSNLSGKSWRNVLTATNGFLIS